MKSIFLILFFFSTTLFAKSNEPLVYLTWKSDPTTSMALMWIASDNIDNHDLAFKVRKKKERHWTKLQASRRDVPGKNHDKIYALELQNLRPDTIYEFRIGKSKKKIFFHTMPAEIKKRVRFIVGGDAYNSSKERFQEMNKEAARQNPRFAIIGGDIAYAVPDGVNSKDENYKKWREFFRCWMHDMKDKDGCQIPLLVAIGNHEVPYGGFNHSPDAAPLFYALFERGYYDISFGDYAYFNFLDSSHTHPVKGEQTDWLYRNLRAANKKKFPHRFAVYHVGAYPSSGSFDGTVSKNVRKYWAPLFERYNIDACFESHDHAYKRTYPLIDGVANPEGVVYFGDGSWGVKPRKPEMTRPYLAAARSSQQVLVVDLTKTERKYKAVDPNGKVIDRYEQKVREG